MSNFEIGYTPSNLKTLLDQYKLTQKDAAKIIGKSRAAFERYLHPVDDDRHVTMSAKLWRVLLNEAPNARMQKVNQAIDHFNSLN